MNKFQVPHEDLRLYQTQEVLAEQLDLPLRLLRADAYHRVMEAVSVRAQEDLAEACAQLIPDQPLEENISEAIVRTLAPSKEAVEIALSRALWLTPISAQNPLFGDLQGRLPGLRARSRLNYLRYTVHKKKDAGGYIPWTGSFIEQFETLLLPKSYNGTNTGILVVGPLWSRSEGSGQESKATSFAELENGVSRLLDSVARRYSQALSEQELEGLMAQASAFVNFDRGFLNSKIRLVIRSLIDALALLQEQGDLCRNLSSVEWGRVVQWIAFWRSRRFSPLLEDHVLRPLAAMLEEQPLEERVSFSLRTSLVGAWKRSRHSIVLDVVWSMGNELPSVQPVFRVEPGSAPGDPGRISFQCGKSGVSLSDDHLQHIQYSYLRFLEERRTARGRQDYLAFDRLRGALQDLPFEENEKRGRLIVRRARRLVMADYAAFFKYDALKDVLRLDTHRAAPWIQKVDAAYMRDALLEAARVPELRERSVVYRGLDSRSIQSHFEPGAQGEGGSERVVPPQLLYDENAWGHIAADFLATPIAFHGRVLGVLYLATAEPNRFRYADRNRIVTFVRSFEAEMFEARLFRSLQRMNTALGRAIKQGAKRRNQDAFVEDIIRELGDLLAVRGVTLWWRSRRHPGFLRLLGAVGNGMSADLKKDLECESSREPITLMRDRREPISLSYGEGKATGCFLSRELPHAALIALRVQEESDPIGLLSFHDSRPISLTPAFAHELAFIAKEVGQNVAEYMSSHDQVEAVRDLIGHEIGTSLRSMDSARVRLGELLKGGALSGGHLETASKTLGDLYVHIDNARQLLDYLTDESVQAEFQQGEVSPIVAFYRYLGTIPQDKPISIRSIINDCFHPRVPDFKAKHVRVKQGTSIIPPLWVRPHAAREVIANLIDNVVKYGIANRELRLDDGCDYMEYFVVVESVGLPLRQEFVQDPGRIFERAVRAAALSVLETKQGKGEGLYIASLFAHSWGGAIYLAYEHGESESRFRFKVTFPRWLADKGNPWLA